MPGIRLLSCALPVALVALGSATAWGQSYPVKPVRVIAPGSGATELVGRIVSQGLSERLGQQFIVDPRPGAGGNLGAELAARAPADGYTIFEATQPQAMNVSLYQKLNYDIVRDFMAVSRLTDSPFVAVVHPSLPVKSIPELVKLAKARPGEINFASAGQGSITFMAVALLKIMSRTNLVEVQYKGGTAAEIAVMGGEVSLYFAPVATGMPFVQSGRLRALAVSSAKRIASYPQIPTIAESGYPDYECSNWHGFMVPAGTPKEVQAVLHKAIVVVLKDPAVSTRTNNLGLTLVGDSPESFEKFILANVEKWRKVVQQTGIHLN